LSSNEVKLSAISNALRHFRFILTAKTTAQEYEWEYGLVSAT